jgi:hypothetical protein
VVIANMMILNVCDSKISIQLDKYVKTRQEYLDAVAILENEREFVLEDLALIEAKIKLFYNNVSEVSKTIARYSELIDASQVVNAPVDLSISKPEPEESNNVGEPIMANIPISTISESNVLVSSVTQVSHNGLASSDLESMDDEDGNGKPVLKPQYANMAIAEAAEAFMSCKPKHTYDAGDLLKALYDGLNETNFRKQRNSLQSQLLRAIKIGKSRIKQSKENGFALYYYA